MSDRLSLSIFTIEIDGKPTLAFEAKRYSFVQLPGRCLCRLGQHLVLGDQRAVYVGQQKANVRMSNHVFCSDS